MSQIDVTIRNVTDLEEVIVSISETGCIGEIRDILAVQVERPELVQLGEFLRILPDGTVAPIKDGMKIGVRRLLGFRGCPLHPPVPERPPPTLEDFAEFDPDEDVIGSPRSARACSLEGVAPEDLLYVPPDAYQNHNIEPRIAELWYDFFEALRQDTLRACRETRQLLIAEEEGNVSVLLQDETRIAGTGGNWCGVLEHSRYDNVQLFFQQRNEMCDVERIYKGATKPFRANLKGSRYASQNESFQDDDPVLAGDSSDDAARKLNRLLGYYNSLPNSGKFVEEQRLVTKANGVVQYGSNSRRLHHEQSEFRRLLDAKIDTAEVQIAIADSNILETNDIRRDMEKRLLESNLAKTKLRDPIDVGERVTVSTDVQLTRKSGKVLNLNGKNGKTVGVSDEDLVVQFPKPLPTMTIKRADLMRTEEFRQLAIKKRAEYFTWRREQVHENALDAQYARCEKIKQLTLTDQAIQERVHQHQNLRKLAFARAWTKSRVRWQLTNNAISSNRNEWNQAILNKHKAAADRVDTQHLIRQKCIEYKVEIKALMRLYADMAAKREKSRQDAIKNAVSNEFSRMSIEEADPSPSPVRRNRALGNSLSSGSFSGSNTEIPYSHLLGDKRVIKRTARFDFGRMGSGLTSSSPTASTRSGNWSLMQSTSMPSIGY